MTRAGVLIRLAKHADREGYTAAWLAFIAHDVLYVTISEHAAATMIDQAAALRAAEARDGQYEEFSHEHLVLAIDEHQATLHQLARDAADTPKAVTAA